MNMNKFVCGLFLVPLFSFLSYAAAPALPAVSTNTPASVNAIADGLHIMDNGTGVTLRDILHGQWLLGVETSFYKQYYTSLDALIAAPVSVANAHALYGADARLWAGQLLYDKVPMVKQYADKTAIAANLLQYGTIGIWVARDFDYGFWRAGVDAGLTAKFGPTGQPTGVALSKAPSYLSRLNLYNPLRLS
jgi:hypothetical protein